MCFTASASRTATASRLGGTEFANMHAAYDDLPADIKTRLDGMTATHNIEKFWEHMRQNHDSSARR